MCVSHSWRAKHADAHIEGGPDAHIEGEANAHNGGGAASYRAEGSRPGDQTCSWSQGGMVGIHLAK